MCTTCLAPLTQITFGFGARTTRLRPLFHLEKFIVVVQVQFSSLASFHFVSEENRFFCPVLKLVTLKNKTRGLIEFLHVKLRRCRLLMLAC